MATEKRRKALFSWDWRSALFANRQSARLDVAKFPGQKKAQEQNYRQANPYRQGASHPTRFGTAFAAIPQHEEQGRGEAGQNAQERQGDDIFHDLDYRPAEAPSPSVHEQLSSADIASLRRRLRFWILALAALLAIGITASMGQWQLSRAAEKEALQAAIDAQKNYPPLEMSGFLAIEDLPAEMHRRVRLRGLWLTDQTVWLDNRQLHGGTPDFYVLTPLALEGSAQTLMVQRGWVQRDFVDRSKLPAVTTPGGIVEVIGQIAPPPGRLLELGKPAASPAPDAPSGSSPIRQNLDLEAFRAETRLPLRTDMTLLETGAASGGLQRDWPAPALGVERHYGYAFQWFGIALLVVILYVWFQIIAPRRRA